MQLREIQIIEMIIFCHQYIFEVIVMAFDFIIFLT